MKITVRKIPYTNNHRKHLRISITLCFAGSESEDSCLSPNSTASGSGASPLRLPTRPNYTQDGYAYTPYSHETYMMAPKSRISPYTRTLDYPSYHHARMKEFYQGTNSCGYNFWKCMQYHVINCLSLRLLTEILTICESTMTFFFCRFYLLINIYLVLPFLILFTCLYHVEKASIFLRKK